MATNSSESRTVVLANLLEIVRRRRTLALIPFVFVLTAATSLAIFLPSLWTAKARILVDRQQIPESFVKSTITSDVESRLLTLSQEILSRARLKKIIETHDLYPEIRRTQSPEDAVDRMRRDIRIDFLGDERERNAPRTVAFTVAYTTTQPRAAMEVANQLAGLYVDGNVRYREKHAAGTSEFLESQLGEVRTRLQGQERKITEFKESHMGELPEQREANLRTLDRLQQQLQNAQESHRRANERRQLLTQTLAEIDPNATAGGAAVAGSGGPSPEASAAARLSLLKQELAQMQSRYNDRYPDVVALRDQIQALEAKLASSAAAAEARTPKPSAAGSAAKRENKEFRSLPQNSYVQSLIQQLDQATIDARIANDEIGSLRAQIGTYQRRIENTPRREQELALIGRDYETTRELFRSLLGKRGEAEIASDLEQRQKGEHFRIVDPAGFPDRAAGPNRLRLFLIGLVVALGASGLAVVIAEHVDTSYRSVEEVRASESVPILSTIPKIVTERDRLRAHRLHRLRNAAVTVGLLAVVATSFVFAHNNHGVVALLSAESPVLKR